MLVGHADFEWGSVLDLDDAGLYRVAEHVETRVWVLSWRLGDGPVQRWRPDDPEPRELLDHVARGGRFVGHNVAAERLTWNLGVRSRPEYAHWPVLRVEQCDCTMARALAVHLPASLAKLGPALGLRATKDTDGGRLMKKMARPRKIYTSGEVRTLVMPNTPEWTRRPGGGAAEWWNTPENIARLGDYCDVDVETESEADLRLPPLSADERALWIRDQHVNDRGVRLDLATVERAAAVRDVATASADQRLAELTGGAVTRHTQGARILGWLGERGIPCESLAKDGLDDLRATAAAVGDAAATEVVDLRAASAKSSLGKLDKMLAVADANDRAQGLYTFHRALTGRWGGANVQPQNLPRVDEDRDLPRVLQALQVLHAHGDDPKLAHDILRAMFGDVAPILSLCLRAMFVSAPGQRFIGADFSNIEGRIAAWLAGEQWKLDAFRAFDTIIEGEFDEKGEPLRKGPDLYKLAVHNAFGVPIAEVTKLLRQKIGKIMELALGYQGSVGAWLRFDRDPGSVTAIVRERYYGQDAWRLACEQYDRARGGHNGLPVDQWVAVKVLVNQWRDANPRITASWWDRQDGAIAAVEAPGTEVHVCGGKVRYLVAEGFFWTMLPSGKLLSYARPELCYKKDDWLVDENGEEVSANEMAEDEVAMRVAAGATLHEGKRKLQVRYRDDYGWKYLYGGIQTNNDCQSLARELLRFAFANVEDAGYPVVLHTHDELVSEVAQEFGTPEHFESLMSILPSWLPGLPLAVKGWSDKRYIK